MIPTFLKLNGFAVCLQTPDNHHLGLFLKLQNEIETRQYFVRYLPIGRKQETEWIDKANTDKENLVFAAATYPDLQAMGSVGLHRIHWKDRNAHLGIGILEKYWGKGFGTATAMLILSYAFNELGLNKVMWHAIGHNARSIGCAKRCGAVEVGRLKRHIWRDGSWHDEVILEIHTDAWTKVWAKYKKQIEKKAKKTSS